MRMRRRHDRPNKSVLTPFGASILLLIGCVGTSLMGFVEFREFGHTDAVTFLGILSAVFGVLALAFLLSSRR